jgi:NADH-quinone oxidoreductase subunit L
MIYQAIVFLPLIGFLLGGFFGRSLGARPTELLTTSLVMVSAALSWMVFIPFAFGDATATKIELFRWIVVGDFDVRWVIRVDTLTAIMFVVVNSVSALVHLYSIGYMSEDDSRQRFFSYLSLFTFAMLTLVTADNLLQMFFGWEGVGVASYLLIGFWYKKSTANAAAMKAFIVNRVGDFGFALGIFAVFWLTGTISFDELFKAAPDHVGKTIHFLNWEVPALTLVCLLLFMGAMGKSAQFLLHTWLPDAMEGPTPVSALIHAATMVTAGVFMVARLSPLFELSPTALTVVTAFGAITAFFAATVGLVQNDIKRIIAYSTCSQLGYMFVALGVGAYGVGVFHLFTHAFFKALLFLGAGSVIHAMHHEQDIRHMGGLAKKIPFTYAMMFIGTIALTGFPFTAGFYSKDAIIEAAYAGQNAAAYPAFILLVVAALMTSFYSWRLVFKTFHGKPQWSEGGHAHAFDDEALMQDNDPHAKAGHKTPSADPSAPSESHPSPAHVPSAHAAHAASAHDDHGHGHHVSPHESPLVMLLPLLVLSLGALGAGVLFHHQFISSGTGEFWRGTVAMSQQVIDNIHHVPAIIPWVPTIMMTLGFLISLYFYIVSPMTPVRLANEQDLLYRFLLNKWYFDELYDFIFVRPLKWLGNFFWKKGDGWLIDGFGPDGLASTVQAVTLRAKKLQTGYVYHYAFAMLIGVAGFISWAIMTGGKH